MPRAEIGARRMRMSGLAVETAIVGDPDPFAAVGDALRTREFDELSSRPSPRHLTLAPPQPAPPPAADDRPARPPRNRSPAASQRRCAHASSPRPSSDALSSATLRPWAQSSAPAPSPSLPARMGFGWRGRFRCRRFGRLGGVTGVVGAGEVVVCSLRGAAWAAGAVASSGPGRGRRRPRSAGRRGRSAGWRGGWRRSRPRRRSGCRAERGRTSAWRRPSARRAGRRAAKSGP